MPADTVTVDRQALYDLLVECHAVCDIGEIVNGSGPPVYMEDLLEKAERVASEILGDTSSHLDEGPREDLWAAGRAEARRWIQDLAAADQVTADA